MSKSADLRAVFSPRRLVYKSEKTVGTANSRRRLRDFICHVSYVSLPFPGLVAITKDSQCECY